MLSLATLRGLFHVRHAHPADAVFIVFSIVFIFIPILVFLYTLLVAVMELLQLTTAL